MRLVNPSPVGYKIIGEVTIPKRGRQPFFARQVVCGGRLYVRHQGRLYVYDVRRGESMDAVEEPHSPVSPKGHVSATFQVPLARHQQALTIVLCNARGVRFSAPRQRGGEGL